MPTLVLLEDGPALLGGNVSLDEPRLDEPEVPEEVAFRPVLDVFGQILGFPHGLSWMRFGSGSLLVQVAARCRT